MEKIIGRSGAKQVDNEVRRIIPWRYNILPTTECYMYSKPTKRKKAKRTEWALLYITQCEIKIKFFINQSLCKVVFSFHLSMQIYAKLHSVFCLSLIVWFAGITDKITYCAKKRTLLFAWMMMWTLHNCLVRFSFLMPSYASIETLHFVRV